jgi:hypothetical protein
MISKTFHLQVIENPLASIILIWVLFEEKVGGLPGGACQRPGKLQGGDCKGGR